MGELNDEDVKALVQNNKAPNTVKKTSSDLNTRYRWCDGVEETREVLYVSTFSILQWEYQCRINNLLHSSWNMARHFTRMRVFHSPSARENTHMLMKYLAIFHSDSCNKDYLSHESEWNMASRRPYFYEPQASENIA